MSYIHDCLCANSFMFFVGGYLGAGHRVGRMSPLLNQSTTTTSTESCKGEQQGNKSPNFLFTPKDVKELRQHPEYSKVDVFTFEEMKLATKHFRPDLILGEGGFGVVYRGVIDENVRPGYKTTEVAIKQLNPNGFQGDREWLVLLHTSLAFVALYIHYHALILLELGVYSPKISLMQSCVIKY